MASLRDETQIHLQQEPITAQHPNVDAIHNASQAPSGPPKDQDLNGASVRRNGSRRRKVSGAPPQAHMMPPAAPEAPEAPEARAARPISYRDPYENGVNTKSFAARARDLEHEGTPLPSGKPPDSAEYEHVQIHQNAGSQVVELQTSDNVSIARQGSTRMPFGAAPLAAPLSAPQPAQIVPEHETHAEEPIEIPISGDSGVGTKRGSGIPARLSTTRGSANPQKVDWAVDHSPLQRLEVKLTDLSKEEKRARVQAAEQRLRDREQAIKARESQVKEAALDPSVTKRSSKRESTRAVREADANRRHSSDQAPGQAPGPGRTQTQGRVVSDILMQAQPIERPEQQTSRIPRPVEPEIISGAGQQPVARSGSQRRRASLEPGLPRLGREDSNPLSRHYDHSQTVINSPHRRSVDDRGVRFHGDPVEEAIAANRPDPNEPPRTISAQQASLYAERISGLREDNEPMDPTLTHAIPGHKGGSKYDVPPQTAAGAKARQLLGFDDAAQGSISAQTGHQHHLMQRLHHHQQVPQPIAAIQLPRHLNEWRQGGTARLMLADIAAKPEPRSAPSDLPWWESPSSGHKRSSKSPQQRSQADYFDGTNEDSNKSTAFDPPLYLKCGPLLRYTGLKRDKLTPVSESIAGDRETWRGSVMIVTIDSQSIYEPAPALRLFHQPMDLLPPPPAHFPDDDEPLPSEYVDPVAGLPKMARNGSTVYVKPAEDFDEGVDYSRDETDDGLFEKVRTANVPTGYGKPDATAGASPLDRPHERKAKSTGRYQEVRGVRLHAERGVTFWRFNLEIELGDRQARVAYRINKGASIGFWVPARGQTMNIMFHSCNGFSASVDPNNFSGPDPLWRDVLNAHQTRPFHVMIGGGDQIYNDKVTEETTVFQEWLSMKNPIHKREAEFTPELRDELEAFYLDRYSMWFSQGLFGMANSQIPMINIWDDHDIIDGYGSYPHRFMSSPVFTGLGNVAFKYYMLFQHQSVPDEVEADEPSWLLGAAPGPYINFPSRSVFLSLGKHVAFLGLDCRTERMRDGILSDQSYDRILDRCRREIIQGETKHLIVLLGVPIAYPRLVWLENILTSRAMDPIKALGRMGMLGNLTNKFDGGYEILDDLDDHWTASHHKNERRTFIQDLQDLAAEKSVRVTILGGDVHLAAVGQFYSSKKLGIPKDQDHRYMPNIISSAIVNTPPPDMMADLLNRRDKVHHLDDYTDEDMIPMFTHDVDGKKRNNRKLLPRRNWCSITEYQPGSTPPPTSPMTPSIAGTPGSEVVERPAARRSFSLTRGNSGPGKLLRRFSLSNREPQSPDIEQISPYDQQMPPRDGYFPPVNGQQQTRKLSKLQRNVSAPPIPTRPLSQFHRRPTNLSEKAVKKGSAMSGGQISLENGLDIRLNCEIKQGDPSGSTESYRLLVPALWYTGGTKVPDKPRRQSVLQRLGSLRGRPKQRVDNDEYYSDVSHEEGLEPPQAAGLPQRQAGGLRVPDVPMGYSVSVESLPQKPRRQSLLQRFGSLRDKIPQLNRPSYQDGSYPGSPNNEYAPNDDAAMMRSAGQVVPPGPPPKGSADSVRRKPRRQSLAQRFGSIGRRLSQMGRPREEYYSDDSYTGSETGSEEDEPEHIASGDLSRPGRQPVVSPPITSQPSVAHQQRTAQPPTQSMSQGANDIPDPFKPRPKIAMSPPPQQPQYSQVGDGPHIQYASTYGVPTTHGINNHELPNAQLDTRAQHPVQANDRRSDGVYNQQLPAAAATVPVYDHGEDYSDFSDGPDSIDDLDSLRQVPQRKQQVRQQIQQQQQHQEPLNKFSGSGGAMNETLPGPGPRKKDISKFFGEDDPADGDARRRMTDAGSGTARNRRTSGGYDGIEAFRSGNKKWWKKEK